MGIREEVHQTIGIGEVEEGEEEAEEDETGIVDMEGEETEEGEGEVEEDAEEAEGEEMCRG